MARWMMVRWAGLAFSLAGLAGCTPPNPASATAALTFLQAPASPSGLVGASPQTLDAEFGPPILRRVDGTAQIWLYHSQICGLNLILYPDTAGTPRVSMAVPDAGADGGDPGRCMASLQRGQTDAAMERPAAS